MPTMDHTAFTPGLQDHVLRLCRAVMPGVAGVVLSSHDGHAIAHDGHADADQLAQNALQQHADAGRRGASALVTGPEGLYLVVFLPSNLADAMLPTPGLA